MCARGPMTSIGPYKRGCDEEISYTRQTAMGEQCSPLQGRAAKPQGSAYRLRQLNCIKKWNYIQQERQYIKKERKHMHNHIYPQPICCKKAG